MCSNVLQPNPPHNSLSLSLTMFPELPFCKPPKNPIFITGLSKEQYFSPSYVGFFVLVRVSQRKQESEKLLTPSPLEPFSLSFLCVPLFLSLSFTFSHVLFHNPPPSPPTFFFLSFCFLPLVVVGSWLVGCSVLP